MMTANLETIILVATFTFRCYIGINDRPRTVAAKGQVIEIGSVVMRA